MTPEDIWVLAIACLVGSSCALVGVFLVLRKMSMLGDAISHSVLFGIALGFLLTSSISPVVMLVSAGVVGLLTAYLTSVLHRHGALQEDASIGVVFTCLFALGVIIIATGADNIDLDQDCVLYGEIAMAAFESVSFFGHEIGPRAFWVLLVVTFCNFIFVILAGRVLKLVSFDHVMASSLGINVAFWHYSLMTMVSMTTVASFEAVGAILVVALLVVPANTALLVVKSVGAMLYCSVFFAILSAFGGYALARYYDASISAAMALMSGVIFVFVLCFIGRNSLLQSWLRARGRVLIEPPLV